MSNLKAKTDGHNKKIIENTPPPKTKLCNCLNKEVCPMKIFYTRIICDDETYKPKLYKGICETTFKKCSQIIKNLSMWKRTRTILSYLLNTGKWQIRNFIHGYPGLYKANINHTTHFRKMWLVFAQKMEILDDPREILLKKNAQKWSPSVAIEVNTN